MVKHIIRITSLLIITSLMDASPHDVLTEALKQLSSPQAMQMVTQAADAVQQQVQSSSIDATMCATAVMVYAGLEGCKQLGSYMFGSSKESNQESKTRDFSLPTQAGITQQDLETYVNAQLAASVQENGVVKNALLGYVSKRYFEEQMGTKQNKTELEESMRSLALDVNKEIKRVEEALAQAILDGVTKQNLEEYVGAQLTASVEKDGVVNKAMQKVILGCVTQKYIEEQCVTQKDFKEQMETKLNKSEVGDLVQAYADTRIATLFEKDSSKDKGLATGITNAPVSKNVVIQEKLRKLENGMKDLQGMVSDFNNQIRPVPPVTTTSTTTTTTNTSNTNTGSSVSSTSNNDASLSVPMTTTATTTTTTNTSSSSSSSSSTSALPGNTEKEKRHIFGKMSSFGKSSDKNNTNANNEDKK